jgi:hypothetical protein
MRFLVRAALAVLLSIAARAELIQGGVKGGISVLDGYALAISGVEESRIQNWLLGPVVEVKLPFGLGAEFNVLYHRFEAGYQNLSTRESWWEFPVLAKWKAPTPVVKPYVSGGLNFRYSSAAELAGNIAIKTSGNSYGYVGAFGTEIRVLMLKVSPEIRYTYWTNAAVEINFPNSNVAASNRHQFDILVGLTF